MVMARKVISLEEFKARMQWVRAAENQLFPKEVRELMKQYPLYSQENTQLADQIVMLRVFSNCSHHVHLITEWDGDDTLFGWSKDPHGGWEGGYFSIKELATTPSYLFGQPVPACAFERDVDFEFGTTLHDATVAEKELRGDCQVIERK